MSQRLEECKRLLKDLVGFDVLGGQSNLSIMAYIKSYLTAHGVSYTLIPNLEGTKTSLHARIGPAVDGGVILSAHTDVVPVAGQAWSSPPFDLIERDGKLYGRGSCDMKAYIACILAMIPAWKNEVLTKPIYIAFSYDEEIGCLAGTELAQGIKDHYTETPKYCIVGEPSMMQPIIGHKGIIIHKTTVKGSAGHSSRIKSEVSAIHVAAELIQWLERKMHELTETDDRFIPNHTSIHIGMIQGGIAPNVIADTCTFYWDVRQIPKTDLCALLDEFFQYTTSLESELRETFTGAAIIHEEDHPNVIPLDTDEGDDVVKLIRIVNQRQDLGTVAYAAEAGQFSDVGFQTVICGPGDIAQAHRADEFVAIAQLELCLEMLNNLGPAL